MVREVLILFPCLVSFSEAWFTKGVLEGSRLDLHGGKAVTQSRSSPVRSQVLDEYADYSDKPINTINFQLKSSDFPSQLRGYHSSFPHISKVLQSVNIAQFIKQTFLPLGYPKTVPQEYRTFQVWNLIQDLCSYLRSIMATRAVLVGMGVGRADVTSAQATIQWILRDGTSMIGGLLFTSLSSYNFVQDVKFWRLFADNINNVGITLDMIAPYFPAYFLPIICLGSICKALCGVAAGATNAAISMHWGEKHGNVADVLAKNNAQHTLISLLGLAVSLPFARLADRVSTTALWLIYSVLTGVHIASNYMAMRVLALRSVNRSRFHILLSRFFSLQVVQSLIINRDACSGQTINLFFGEYGERFTPRSVAERETILPHTVSNRNKRMKFYCSPSAALEFTSQGLEDLSSAIETYAKEEYFVLFNKETQNGAVCVSLGCSVFGQVKAHLEAYLQTMVRDMARARELTEILAPSFWELMRESDWAVDNIQLKPSGAFFYKVRP